MYSSGSLLFKLLGESDENPFGARDVAEPIHVFVLNHFADELRAAFAEAFQTSSISRRRLLLQKPALFGDGGGIPCAMENANNNKIFFAHAVVNGIGLMKRHAQPDAELIPCCSHQWRLPHHV